MMNVNEHRILQAIFVLSRETRPIDAGGLSRLVGVSTTEVGRTLVRLERAGLVDAGRARLTMLGLAHACQAADDQSGSPLDLSAVDQAVACEGPPLAAKGAVAAATESIIPAPRPAIIPGSGVHPRAVGARSRSEPRLPARLAEPALE